MASPSGNSEASEVRRRGRQRLIGAVVLVLLLVVFVPMLLDSEPKAPRETPNLAIPSKDNAPPLPAPVVAPSKDGAQSPPAVTPAPTATPAQAGAQSPPAKDGTPAAPQAPPVPAAAVARVEPVAGPSQATAAPAQPAAKAGPTAGEPVRKGFVVQVGAFRDEAKLQQAQAKLKAANVAHYTEKMDGRAGTLTRLRAGPYATREQAEAAQVAIKRAALDGKVIPLP